MPDQVISFLIRLMFMERHGREVNEKCVGENQKCENTFLSFSDFQQFEQIS